jgi:anthranilate/para-aminobenzoate synthase component I
VGSLQSTEAYTLFFHVKSKQWYKYYGCVHAPQAKFSIIHYSYEGKIIELNYAKKMRWIPSSVYDFSLNCIREPKFSHYKKTMAQIKNYIALGEFYQLNYTNSWTYQINGDVENVISNFAKQVDNLSAYAHISYIPQDDLLLISNSPECLFQIKKKKSSTYIESIPIKGSVKCDESTDQYLAKKTLLKSKKNQAELYMITDLITNDLNKLGAPYAQVVKNKMCLKVPGILHTASVVRKKCIKNQLSIKKLMTALFPGGSITGAPKISAMNYIRVLESRERENYCGSTVFLHSKGLCASINIRTAQVNLKTNELVLQAGGGITWQSKVKEEWNEMHFKKESLLKMLKYKF